MVCIVPLSHEETKAWSLVLHKPENGRAGTSLYETRAGARNLGPEWPHATHALCLPGGQLLTLSNPLGINSWGLAEGIDSIRFKSQ